MMILERDGSLVRSNRLAARPLRVKGVLAAVAALVLRASLFEAGKRD